MAGKEQKGAFGPYDSWNRFSRKWSWRIAAGAGVGWAVGVPVAGTIAVLAALNGTTDHLQIKTSEWLRKKIDARKAVKMQPNVEYKVL